MGRGQSEVLRVLTKTPVELLIGEKKYKMAPLQLDQVAALDEWAEQQPFERLNKRFAKFPDLFTETQKSEQIEDAGRIAADPLNRATEVGSLAGVVKALELSLSIHHPNISRQEIVEIVKVYSIEQLTALLNKFSEKEDSDKKK